MTEFHDFLHQTQYDDIPEDVIQFARRCLLDLTGVLISGSATKLSKIISNHAHAHFGSGSKTSAIILKKLSAGPAGAALANGMTLDAIDAHDGFKPAKGHVGCHVLPTLLAFGEAESLLDGKEFLASLVVGYEIGSRAAVALHGSVPDYHTSGAWGAVTSAALGARLLKLDQEQTRHAIGIGEYHGPRSQMMRVIDHPTMLKDGSGWGAMAGISAAYLAQDGFTGAPAITVEHGDIQHYWQDLGKRWLILEQYFKAYPVCRWAQPATEAALGITQANNIHHQDIKFIEAHTFAEGCALATREPEDTEEAQYSLPFPVAASLVFGKLEPEEISANNLSNPDVLRLSNSMKLIENEDYNAVFPQQRYAHVVIELNSGERLTSERHTARGDPEDHLTMNEIQEKFHSFASPVVGEKRSSQIEKIIMQMGKDTDLGDLLAALKLPA